MIKRKISDIISNIDEEYICEATEYTKLKSRIFWEWIKRVVGVVCLVFLFVSSAKLFSVFWDVICSDKQEKLVICTDYITYDTVESVVSSWKKSGRVGSGIDVEIVKISRDETAAQIKITEIRTEIMAGKGPDLFVFASDLPYVTPETRITHMLFTIPEKFLYADVFLPLDSYLKESSYITIENCNQAVLKAGQTEEGQLLLPMIYNYGACIFPEDKNTQEIPFPNSWDDIIANATMRQALLSQSYLGFLSYLGPYADYEREELLLSEDDLIKQFNFSRFAKRLWENVSFEIVTTQYFLHGQLGNSIGQADTFYAVPNIDGGVTANISVYAGINRNTKVADEAFSVLESIYESIKNYESFPSRGICIEQDEYVQKLYESYHRISQENIESFYKMNATVTEARFYSVWDYNLYDIFMSSYTDYDSESIEQKLRNLYTTMQMQLKE